jgi:hypothetical protein
MMKSGLRASAGALMKVTQAITRVVTYEQTIRDKTRRCRWRFGELFDRSAEHVEQQPCRAFAAGYAERTVAACAARREVVPEGYTVVHTDTLTSVDGITSNLSYAKPRSDLLITERPNANALPSCRPRKYRTKGETNGSRETDCALFVSALAASGLAASITQSDNPAGSSSRA